MEPPTGIAIDRPVDKKWPITCPYGKQGAMWLKGWHQGVDFGVPEGTTINAVMDGIVQLAGLSRSYGNRVWVISEHPEFGKIRHLYAHAVGLMVSEAEEVKKGQLLAYSGATGNVSGPHLHFEVRRLETDEPIQPIFT